MNAFRTIRATCLIAVVAAGALLVGCASTGSSLASRTDGKFQKDLDYMAAVESGARNKGVRVVWVHPPYEQGKSYTH